MKKVLDTKSSYLFDFGVHKSNLCVILYLSIYLPTLSVDNFCRHTVSVCVGGWLSARPWMWKSYVLPSVSKAKKMGHSEPFLSAFCGPAGFKSPFKTLHHNKYIQILSFEDLWLTPSWQEHDDLFLDIFGKQPPSKCPTSTTDNSRPHLANPRSEVLQLCPKPTCICWDGFFDDPGCWHLAEGKTKRFGALIRMHIYHHVKPKRIKV